MLLSRWIICYWMFKFLFSFSVFLLGSRTHTKLQQFSHFMLTAQASNGPTREGRSYVAGPKRVGRFQLFSDSLTKFHEQCVNTVAEADDFPKTEVQVMWVTPASGSGCIRLSAMVFENANSWFSEDEQLTKIICESKSKPQFKEGECCACDEAKYNVSDNVFWIINFKTFYKNLSAPSFNEFYVFFLYWSNYISVKGV